MGKVLAALMFWAGLSLGSQIVPSSVFSYSTAPGFDANNLINGFGLAGGLHDSNPGTMWQSDNMNPGLDMPFGMLEFSFGGPVNIQTLEIWNWNATGMEGEDLLGRGVSTFEIRYSFGGATISAGWFNLMKGSGGMQPRQTFVLSNAILANSIQLVLVSNHGDPSYLGLSEIAFYSNALTVPGNNPPPPPQPPPPPPPPPDSNDPPPDPPSTGTTPSAEVPNVDMPEPSTWGLMGLGLSALWWRAKKK